MANDAHIILAGWDGSERARDAVALAGLLARIRGAHVLVVHVAPAFPNPWEPDQDMIDAAARVLAEAPTDQLHGIETSSTVVRADSPADGLHRAAEDHDAGLVAVGSTHRGPLGRVVPGSVATNLLHGAPCPVAVAPAGFAGNDHPRLRTIAVAYDGSPEARGAADVATQLAKSSGAAVRVITAAVPLDYGWATYEAPYVVAAGPDGSDEASRRTLDEEVEEIATEVPASGEIRFGDPPEVICEACKDGIDLLLMGSRRYGTVRRVLLGSVSSRVIRSAPCPVLVIPQGAGDAHDNARHARAAVAD